MICFTVGPTLMIPKLIRNLKNSSRSDSSRTESSTIAFLTQARLHLAMDEGAFIIVIAVGADLQHADTEYVRENTWPTRHSSCSYRLCYTPTGSRHRLTRMATAYR